MRRWLCTVEPIPDRPDIAWVALPIDPRAVNFGPSPFNRKVVGDGVQCYSLDGEEVPGHRKGVTVLQAVGSFETPAELITLITPMLVEKASLRIDELGIIAHGTPAWSAGNALRKLPYETSCWILRATPEELQSWAETLARRT
jgi:hypothetical protein